MTEIESLENKIMELTQQVAALRTKSPSQPIEDYEFEDLHGSLKLSDLFAGKTELLLIHNMGQGCRYCTLWADGINGFLPHLENELSVVLVSKDSPEIQRRFANSRGWRFRTASHRGGKYITEQSAQAGEKNQPGAVFYEKKGDKIFRKNSAKFGPYDLYCSIWNLLALTGRNSENWTPQYSYWQRPSQLDDGGKNLK